MNRTSRTVLMSLLLSMFGCDGDGAISSGEDCRRAADACAPGYRCLPMGDGVFECVPGRDAMVNPMDMLVLPMEDGSVETDSALVLTDGSASSDSAPMMTSDAETPTNSDAGSMMTSDANFLADAAEGDLDADSLTPDAGGSEEDAGNNPMPDAALGADLGPPLPAVDQGVPVNPDAAIADPVDMGGGRFGPGRCNYDAMWPREARDLGGQDQNGARQIQPGVYRDLTVGLVDTSDWYRVEVCPDGVLSVTVDFGFDGVDLDLDVWHPNEGRLGQSQELCTGRESFRWQNDGEVVDIRFNVYPWAPPGRDGNNRYDLTVELACPQ